jgi:PAS domain S-box-containing protein
MRGPDLVVELANPRREGLPQGAQVEGLTADAALEIALAEPAARERYVSVLRHTLATGETQRMLETPLLFNGAADTTHWDIVVLALRDGPDHPPEGVVLFANEVTRFVSARTRAEEAEGRFNALVDAGVVGVTISDGEHFFEANDAFLELVGRTRADLEAGLLSSAISDPTYRDADRRAIAAVIEEGAAGPYEKAYLRPDGSRVSVLLSAARVSDDPLRILATTYDLSERKAAEAEVAALLARTRRLQEITATLSASNSAAAIARAVVHHGLEELSASAGVLVRTESAVPVEHAVGLPLELVENWRAFPATLPESLRSPAGRPVPAGDLLEGGCLIAVPITGADGASLGTLALAFREELTLAGPDADFLVALAWQAGLALDRIRLYEDRAYVARKLQEGLLPHRLDDVPSLESAVVYESISGGGEVGGDFYDLFEAGAGRWLACVGDVCGKGTEAAVITGLARHTIRAAAHMSDSPAETLAFLNRALRRHAAAPSFCTVGCVGIQAAADGRVAFRLASGGHPFPLVLRADGTLEEVEVGGTMLGVSDQPDLADVALELDPGDALLLYTDGVTDARRLGGERFGEDRLLAAVRAAAGQNAQGIADTVEAAVRAHLPGASADDRAVVVLRVRPS